MVLRGQQRNGARNDFFTAFVTHTLEDGDHISRVRELLGLANR